MQQNKNATEQIIRKIFREELDRFDKKFDSVEKRLDGFDKKFDSVEKRLDGFDKKFETIEDAVKNLKKEVDMLERIFKVELKLTTISVEQRFEEKLTKFTDKILTAIDPLLKELESREQDREISTSQSEEIRQEISKLKKRLSILESPHS